MKKLIFLSILLSSLWIQSCEKEENCPQQFQILATTTPYQETYQVGDTIKVVSKFHKLVYDKHTEKRFDMEDINWMPGLGILRLDRDSSASGYVTNKYFDFAPNETNNLRWYVYSDGSSQIDGDYHFAKDSFSLQIKLIAKATGSFYLLYGSFLYQSHQDFPGKCKRYFFDVYTTINEGRDGNIHLLEESPNPHFNDWVLQKPQERFHNAGGFCFRVID